MKVDAWLCSPCPTYVIDKNLLETSKNLKLIVTPSTGSNHIDLDYCKKRSITVKTLLKTKFIKNIHASSEFTFSLMLAVLKKYQEHYQLLSLDTGEMKKIFSDQENYLAKIWA